MQKVFSVKKYEDNMKKNPLISDNVIELSKKIWANECEGLTKEEMEKNGYLVHDEWMIVIE